MSSNGGPSSSPGPDRLNGWKDIAAFLGKGVRTVQRWEKGYGLPVRRLGGETGEIVFADRRELEDWIEKNSRLAGTPAPEAAPRVGRISWHSAVVIVVAAFGIAVFSLRDSIWPSRPQQSQWRVTGGRLHVLDSQGTELYSPEFGFPLNDGGYSSAGIPEPRAAQFVDADADGTPELLFKAFSEHSRTEEGFYLLNNDGTTRWSVRPQDHVVFNGVTYAAPWHPYIATVATNSAGATIFYLSFIHADRSPSALLTVDSRGQVISKYWQDGYIETVAPVVWHGRPTVFVGGTNDESRGGSVAVFENVTPGGSAPAKESQRECSGCPPGKPTAFLLFPAGEIAASQFGGGTAKSGSATVTRVWTDATDSVLVYVGEGPRTAQGNFDALLMYQFSTGLALKGADPSEGLLRAHRELERRDLLDHPFDAARERVRWFPVHLWKGGWSVLWPAK
jgi:hypothetical protein